MPLRLVSFEGLDGVGKTTQVELLVGYLRAQGVEVATHREPGGTPLGERLRELLHSGLAGGTLAELLLFIAARAELVETVVKPELAAGKLVVLDRFTDSTWAYQGALGIPQELLTSACALGSGGLTPSLTFWLDLEPAVALARRGGAPDAIDAIEQRDRRYFTRVRELYAALAEAEPERIVRLDARAEPLTLGQQVLEQVARQFGLQPVPVLAGGHH